LCGVLTLQDAAELTGLSWDTVKDIHKAHLRHRYKTINLKTVRYLALDEVYLGHKRKFVTIVMDLETGRVIHLGQGIDVRIDYDSAQTTPQAIRDAISEPCFDEAENRCRMSPFKIQG
jgi:transposase